MEKTIRFVRNTWLEGNGSLCFGITSEIVKNLDLNQDCFLYVEMVDNLIVMKKHDPKLTKTEKTKSKTINGMADIRYHQLESIGSYTLMHPVGTREFAYG